MPKRPRSLRIEVADTTSPTTVVLIGEMDLVSAARVKEALLAIANSGEHRVVVDMSNVTFMDSSGIGALVGGLKRFRALEGEVILRSLSPTVRRSLEITGLTRVFTLE